MLRYVKADSNGRGSYIKVYQIDDDRDMQLYYDTRDSENPQGRVMFSSYDKAQKYGWDESLYNLVWEGDVPTSDLDEIYGMFGNNYSASRPDDFRGHTLSVSDVVVRNGKAFYCDSFGWKPIEFDESRALYSIY